MELDCQRCGACCCNPDENRMEEMKGWVPVRPDDRLWKRPRLVQRYVLRGGEGAAHLRLDDRQRCTALRGKLGARVWCAIYEDRPRACRSVEAGSARCLQYRRERGIA